MKALVALTALVLALALAPVSALGADESLPPIALLPADGATMPIGQSPLFRVQSYPGDGYLWLHVSRSPATDASGIIGWDVEIEPFLASVSGSGIYDAQPELFDYSEFWMNQPGTYYWQAYRISYANGADGAVEGPVRTLTLTADGSSAPPPPTPAVPPDPPSSDDTPETWFDVFPDLSAALIPRWVARNRRDRGFEVSRANLPSAVGLRRWIALVDTSAARWRLRSRRLVNRLPRQGNFHNELGFAFDLPRGVLGSTIAATVVHYRMRLVCGAYGCHYRRQIVGRTVRDRDIVLNHRVRWQQGPRYPGPRQYDLQTVLLHEMGHLAGNGHRPRCRNTPMVYATAAGEWWRSADDHSWLGCGRGGRAASAAGRFEHRVLRVLVPVNASREAVDRALQAAAARDEIARRREALGE